MDNTAVKNLEKYDKVFMELFTLPGDFNREELKMNNTEDWDSVGHMTLITALEDAFDVMFETEDILGLASYTDGIKILKKYGVNI